MAIETDSVEAAVEESPVKESIPSKTAVLNEEGTNSETTAQQESNGGNMLGMVIISILAIAIAIITYRVFKMKK